MFLCRNMKNIYLDTSLKNLYHSPNDQISFESTGLLVQEKFNIDFQGDSHFGFPVRMILSTFDLQITLILPMKVRVNRKVQNRFSRWQLWWPYWISDLNNFSYFLSTSHPDTAYQVSS